MCMAFVTAIFISPVVAHARKTQEIKVAAPIDHPDEENTHR